MPRAKTLTVNRPSSSTASYTVSNASLPQSSLGVLFHRVSLLLRVILAIACVGLFLGRWQVAFDSLSAQEEASGTYDTIGSGVDRATHAENVVLVWLEQVTEPWVGVDSPLGQGLQRQFGTTLALWAPTVASVACLWVLSRRGYVGKTSTFKNLILTGSNASNS